MATPIERLKTDAEKGIKTNYFGKKLCRASMLDRDCGLETQGHQTHDQY